MKILILLLFIPSLLISQSDKAGQYLETSANCQIWGLSLAAGGTGLVLLANDGLTNGDKDNESIYKMMQFAGYSALVLTVPLQIASVIYLKKAGKALQTETSFYLTPAGGGVIVKF